MPQDRSSKGGDYTTPRANLADERSPGSVADRGDPKAGYKAGYADTKERSRSPTRGPERDSRSKQLNPSNPTHPARQTERTSRPRQPNKDRAAQEAHREFMKKLAKTRGEGFVWLDD
jgi:hypothetical protein